MYERLREWIVRGPLEAGETIRDGEIAQRLGVSRTPVREALVRLEQEDLVEILPGRWTRVAPLRYEQAGNMYAIGAALDALAAEQAATLLTASDLGAMQRHIDRLYTTTDPLELQKADEEFHDVYVRAAANPLLGQLHASIQDALRRFERVNFRDPVTPEVAHREHSAILDALRARDAVRAREAARFNWMNAWPRVAEMLSRSARDANGGSETPKRRREVAR